MRINRHAIKLAFAVASALASAITSKRASAQSGATVALPITFIGEVRTRSEFDHVPGRSTTDFYTFLRARLAVRVDPSANARIFLQMQDSRVLGSEGNPAASAADVFELHQGYLELSHTAHGRRVAVRAGRQEISLGNERLVGLNNWSNIGRSLDGFRLYYNPAGKNDGPHAWTLTAFGATIEERGQHYGVPAGRVPTSDHTLAAAYGSRWFSSRTYAEATLLYDGGAGYRQFVHSDRGTIDARLHVPLAGVLRAELEGAWQFGHQQFRPDSTTLVMQRVQAWLGGARIGNGEVPTSSALSRAVAPQRVVVNIGADALSGDTTPHDAHYSAFATLFASNHSLYGLIDAIGEPATTTRDRGLIDFLAVANARITPAVSVRAEAHRFALATGRDRAYGSELDVAVPVRVGTAAAMEFGYAGFVPERAATVQGLGSLHRVRQWAYLQLRASF